VKDGVVADEEVSRTISSDSNLNIKRRKIRSKKSDQNRKAKRSEKQPQKIKQNLKPTKWHQTSATSARATFPSPSGTSSGRTLSSQPTGTTSAASTTR